MQLEKTFLDQIFRIFRPAGCPDRQREDIPSMFAIKLKECTFISRGGTSGEIFVGNRHVPWVARAAGLVHRTHRKKRGLPDWERRSLPA